jgi:hypothetical protein
VELGPQCLVAANPAIDGSELHSQRNLPLSFVRNVSVPPSPLRITRVGFPVLTTPATRLGFATHAIIIKAAASAVRVTALAANPSEYPGDT